MNDALLKFIGCRTRLKASRNDHKRANGRRQQHYGFGQRYRRLAKTERQRLCPAGENGGTA